MEYKHVFLVDDNDTTNFYNVDVLGDAMPNAKIESFTSASQFKTHYISACQGLNERLLLLLDINMPEMQGFELVEELEENCGNLDNLDIIILSSSNLKIDREKATKYPNIFGFIEKPLTGQKLNNSISGIF